jgi:hypothetical protein
MWVNRLQTGKKEEQQGNIAPSIAAHFSRKLTKKVQFEGCNFIYFISCHALS